MPTTKPTTRTDFTPQTSSNTAQPSASAVRTTRPLHALRNATTAETAICAASSAALDRASHAMLQASMAMDIAQRHHIKAASLRQEVNQQWEKLNRLLVLSLQKNTK